MLNCLEARKHRLVFTFIEGDGVDKVFTSFNKNLSKTLYIETVVTTLDLDVIRTEFIHY